MSDKIPAAWTRLAWAAALLMGLASWAGVFVEGVYAKEAPVWAAQGVGQDLANLFVALPILVVSTLLAGRRAPRGTLVALGALLYVVYSYVLYAFFVHFGPWFPVYVGTLGFSFYALVRGVAQAQRDDLSRCFGPRTPVRLASVFLMVVGVMFAAMWLGEIVPALASGRPPQSVEDVGFPVNPVHVLDLALVLPAMMATSVLLWRRRPAGYLFAVPLLVFLAVMGVAILAMAGVMYVSEIEVPAAMIVIIGPVVLVSLALAAALLRHAREAI